MNSLPLNSLASANSPDTSEQVLPVDVVLSQPDHDALLRHLLQNDHEQHAFLLAGLCFGESSVRLLVREIIFAQPHDFLRQTSSYLELKPSYYLPVLDRCRHEGLHIVEVHSHTFCGAGVTFSPVDIGNEWEKFPWYAEKLPGIWVGTLVFGHASVDGHWFDAPAGQIRPLRLLRVVGRTPLDREMTSWRATDLANLAGDDLIVKNNDATHFVRQELAFGSEGQRRIATARIGLLGTGGLGSIVAALLSRQGARIWTIVDPDRIELSNLNRVAFAWPEDAAERRPKVEVIARGICDIRRDAHVLTVQNSVDSPIARKALREVDLLISAPDNDGARLVANELATSYLLPLVDLGSGINVRDGAVVEAGGQMLWRFPGEGCLHCAGAINNQRARIDLMTTEERARHEARGYGTSSPQPSVMFLNATLAGLAVGEITKWLTGLAEPCAMLIYDALAPSVRTISSPGRNAACAVCHPRALYGRGDETHLDEVFSQPAPATGNETPTERDEEEPHVVES